MLRETFARIRILSFLHISSSYAKILGKTNFSLGSFPKVFQKQKTEKKKIYNNGQLRIANATSGGARKAAWAKRRKLVITMASCALQTPPRVAHAKPPGPITNNKTNKSQLGGV